MSRTLGLFLFVSLAGAFPVLAQGNNASIHPGESSVPSSIPPGGTADVRVRVYNQGTTTWRAATAHRLGAQYEGNPNQVAWSGFACGGYVNGPTDARAFLCGDVPPGGFHDFRFRITAPAGISGATRLSVRMVQDGVQWFGPSFSWSISVASGLPDVVVDSVALSPPGPMPGQAVSFSSVVRNQGATPTPPGVTIGVGYFVDGGYKTWGAVAGPLAPGASITITTQGGPWAATSGSHTLMALADDVNRFGEANENNNSRTIPFSVSSSRLPDVVVDSVSLSPATPRAGQAVLFTSVVRNAGSAPTPSGVTVGVGYFVDGQYKTWGSVAGPLAAGASITITTRGGAWAATSGSHTATALADDVNRFPESNENNNSRSAPFTVEGPPPTLDADLYGMNVDPMNPAGRPEAQQLLDIGVRWLRIEWKARGGYALYDPLIASYRSAGLRVMLILDYTTAEPKPPFNASDATWRSYLAAFNAAVSELARHYGNGVDAWQIWNEPDLFAPVPGYDPGVPAHHFGAMLRDSVTAIRPHSSRPIVTGGLASGDPGYLSRARDAVGGLTVDAVGVHPYGQRAPDNWPHPNWGFGNMSALLDRYLAFGFPLWVTEINTDQQSIQADYLENVYALIRDEYPERVPIVFWFCWSDGMVFPFGVVDSAGRPKSSYFRYQAITP